MNKLEIAKKTATFIVGIGTSKVTKDIIRNNTTPRHAFDQISIGATSIVAGSMFAIQTKAHTETMIDEAVEAFKKLNAKKKN